jgi:hypothetical protein
MAVPPTAPAPPPKTSSAVAAPAPATSPSREPIPVSASAEAPGPRSASPLSPAATPFYPRGSTAAGEVTPLHLSDDEYDDLEQVDYSFTPSPSPTPRPSYCDVVRGSPVSAPLAVATVPVRPRAHAMEGTGETVAAPRRQLGGVVTGADAPPGESAAPQPPVAGMPNLQPQVARRRISPELAARLGPIPLRHISLELQARFGPIPPLAQASNHRHRPRVDADGFKEVVSHSRRRPRRESDGSSSSRLHQAQRSPPLELAGRCLNCLCYAHRVATCRLPPQNGNGYIPDGY